MIKIGYFLSIILILGIVFIACSNPNVPIEEAVSESTELIQALSVEDPVFNPDTFRYDLQFVMGKFDPTKHPDFVNIKTTYANRGDRFMHKEAYAAFIKMYEAAKQDGITLTIVSAARNFDSQKNIWNAKWEGRILSNGENVAKNYPAPKTKALKILEYSSMPGSSRHHWGTDIDLISLNNAYFETGKGKEAYEWLLANAATYGFCQPYTAGRPSGYQEERWHWSYLPIAEPLAALARLQLKDELLDGFAGSEMTQELGIVENYVLGINLECLPH